MLIEFYLPLKHTHISLVVMSIGFFTLRAIWAISETPFLQHKWVRITPHIIDTLLLLTAIILAVSSHQYPFKQHWLTAKVLALCFYILFGTMTIKHAKTTTSRLVYMVLSLTTFVYILSVAFTKDPLPFL